MPSLTLKNIPDDLLRTLRAAAERDRRSLNQEVMHLLTVALRERAERPAAPRAEVEAQLAAWRALAGRWESGEDLATETKRIAKGRTRGRKVAL